MDEFILTIDDIENVVKTHLGYLDKLWPDTDQFGPRKVHLVELVDGIRLKLHQVAESNLRRNESAFEKAARKITNSKKELPKLKAPEPIPEAKSDMQIAHEKAREARRSRITGA